MHFSINVFSFAIFWLSTTAASQWWCFLKTLFYNDFQFSDNIQCNCKHIQQYHCWKHIKNDLNSTPTLTLVLAAWIHSNVIAICNVYYLKNEILQNDVFRKHNAGLGVLYKRYFVQNSMMVVVMLISEQWILVTMLQWMNGVNHWVKEMRFFVNWNNQKKL